MDRQSKQVTDARIVSDCFTHPLLYSPTEMVPNLQFRTVKEVSDVSASWEDCDDIIFMYMCGSNTTVQELELRLSTEEEEKKILQERLAALQVS